jgi:hypothetical protein
MTKSIGGVVALEKMLSGICADMTLDERDPAGETFIRLLGAPPRFAQADRDHAARCTQLDLLAQSAASVEH